MICAVPLGKRSLKFSILKFNNNVFSRHLGHLRTVSFMKMGARFLAKFTSAFFIMNMECFNGTEIKVLLWSYPFFSSFSS